MQISLNHAARRDAYADHPALPAAAMLAAQATIAGWDGYAPTPLRTMPGLAAALGLGAVGIKEEGARFKVGSFKALGPPYALARAGGGPGWTAVAATSGNHGRALAWGAARLGAGCVIYMPAHTSAGREAAIRSFGADVVRTAGDYDAALAEVVVLAEHERHLLIADMPWRGSDAIARDILAGYSVVGAELAAQGRPTHVFVAAGNGGLAAATAARLWHDLGSARPMFCTVEPEASDAIRRSLAAGGAQTLGEGPGSVMDGLVVRAPSALGWPLLHAAADAGLAIGDAAAVAVLHDAARGAWGDAPIEIGETGIAALAGLVAAASDPASRAALGLAADSRVVAIACEGVTDRQVFEALLARA